jgi:hypothetical protein
VEDDQTRPDFIGEGEQVQLGAQLAVVAAFGLGKTIEVRLELVARRPRRAVDPLELRVLLAAAPVRGGRPHQLERRDHPGGRQVRAAAQVAPDPLAVPVHVVVVGQLAVADLHDLVGIDVALEVDQLQLVRLRRQLHLRLVERLVLPAAERLPGLDDLLHPLLELRQVLRLERLRHVEVVVEAVLDRRADAELGLGEDVLHGLGQHVRGRVAQHVEPVRLVDRDRGHVGVELGRQSRSRSRPAASRTTTIALGPLVGRPAAATASAAVVPAGTTTGRPRRDVRDADTAVLLHERW